MQIYHLSENLDSNCIGIGKIRMSSEKDFSEVYNEYYLKVFRHVRGKITSYH